jgi:DNA-binding MarR family transcriptional regulator
MENRRIEITAKLFYKTILTQIINIDLEDVAKNKLTQVQFFCMYYVFVHNEPSVGAIADGLNTSDAAAVKLIDRLVKKKLLLREEDPFDRRVLKIKLTAQGQELLERYCTTQTELFNNIIKMMPEEAVSSLAYGLSEFLKAALLKPEHVDAVCLKCGWKHIPDCPGNVRYIELTGQEKENV